MVFSGGVLENGMKSGKIAYSPSGSNSQKKSFSGFPKKKEGETNAITGAGSHYNPPPNFQYHAQTLPTPPIQNNQGYKPQNYQERKPAHFDPIPITYTDLFNHLMAQNVITPRPMRPVQPPFSRFYNPNATCVFHAGAVGHTVEDCKAFKSLVQELIETKWLTFEQNGPNVATNPLPGHGAHSTNAIEELAECSLIKKVEWIQTPLEIIHAELCDFRVITKGCEVCTDSQCVGACEVFKLALQDLLDRHVIQAFQEKEENVSTLHLNNGQSRDM